MTVDFLEFDGSVAKQSCGANALTHPYDDYQRFTAATEQQKHANLHKEFETHGNLKWFNRRLLLLS